MATGGVLSRSPGSMPTEGLRQEELLKILLETPGSDGTRVELRGQQKSQVLAKVGHWGKGQQHSER